MVPLARKATIDSTAPTAPTIIRMTPTVCTLNPCWSGLVVRAKSRTAPTAKAMMLATRPAAMVRSLRVTAPGGVRAAPTRPPSTRNARSGQGEVPHRLLDRPVERGVGEDHVGQRGNGHRRMDG